MVNQPTRQFIRQYFAHLSEQELKFLETVIDKGSSGAEKIKNGGTMNDQDKRDLKAAVFEIIKSQFKSFKATKGELSSEDIRLARLVHAHMNHSDNVNRINEIVNEPLPYEDGVKTLSSEYGEYVPKFSDDNMGVFHNPEKNTTTLTFRGSRSLTKVLNNKSAREDWIRNFRNSILTEKDTPEYTKYIERINELKEQFPNSKFLHSGFSKGGGSAISTAEDSGHISKTYNPHINKNHNLTEAKSKHTILRTDEDMATIGLASTGRNENVDVDTIPSKKGSNSYSSHSLNQFTTSGDRRTNFEFVAKADSHVSLTRMKEMFNNLDYYKQKFPEMAKDQIIKLAKRGVKRTASRPSGAKGFEDTEMTTTRARIDESNVPGSRRPQITSFDGIETTSSTKKDFINRMSGDRRESGATIRNTRRPLSTSIDSDFFQVEPQQELTPDPRMSEEFGNSSPYSREGLTNYLAEQKGISGRVPLNDLPSGTSRAYLDSSPRERKLMTSSLDDKINKSSQSLYDEYQAPMEDSMRLGQFKMAGAVASATGAGMATAIATQAILNNVDPNNKLPPPAKDAITGFVSGAGAEIAGLKLAGAGLDLSRIGSGAISGGVGLLVGDLTTTAIKNAFGNSKNYYAKDILSNVAGTAVGTTAGIATGIGLGAVGTSLATGATLGTALTESAVGFANAWNPVGWALLALSAGTAIGVGVYEAQQEQKNADNEAILLKEQKEILKTEEEGRTAEKAVGLNSQYDHIIDYLKSMGASNIAIAKVKNELLQKIKDKDSPLNSEEYQKTFKNSIDNFNVGGNSSLTVAETQDAQFSARYGTMTSLIDTLKENNIDVDPPNNNAYIDTENFTASYNNILAGISKSEREKLGLSMLPPVYKDDFNQDLINPYKMSGYTGQRTQDIADRMNASEREDFYQKYPNLAISDGYDITKDEYTLDPFGVTEQPLVNDFKTAGQAIVSTAQTVGSAITTTAENVGKSITSAIKSVEPPVPEKTQIAVNQANQNSNAMWNKIGQSFVRQPQQPQPQQPPPPPPPQQPPPPPPPANSTSAPNNRPANANIFSSWSKLF